MLGGDKSAVDPKINLMAYIDDGKRYMVRQLVKNRADGKEVRNVLRANSRRSALEKMPPGDMFSPVFGF